MLIYQRVGWIHQRKTNHWWPIPAPKSIGSWGRQSKFPGCIPDFTFEDLELYRVVCVGTTSMLNVIESSFQIGWTINENFRIQQMEVRKRTIFQAIFSGDIPWNLGLNNRPYIW